MIHDFFEHIGRYGDLPKWQQIKKFVAVRDCKSIPNGEHEILGRDLFVRVASYETGLPSEKKFEAHRIYADLQLVVAGEELMGYAPQKTVGPATDYDAKADIQFYEVDGAESNLYVPTGKFVLFYPGELHRPGCWVSGKAEKVKKLVFKIKV